MVEERTDPRLRQARLAECAACGLLVAVDARACPHCGQPNDRDDAERRWAARQARIAANAADRAADAAFIQRSVKAIGLFLLVLVLITFVGGGLLIVAQEAMRGDPAAQVEAARERMRMETTPAEAPASPH